MENIIGLLLFLIAGWAETPIGWDLLKFFGNDFDSIEWASIHVTNK